MNAKSEMAELRGTVDKLREVVLGQIGMIGALEAAVLTLVRGHPVPQALRKALETNFEALEANMLGASVAEPTLDAFRQLRARVAEVAGGP